MKIIAKKVLPIMLNYHDGDPVAICCDAIAYVENYTHPEVAEVKTKIVFRRRTADGTKSINVTQSVLEVYDLMR